MLNVVFIYFFIYCRQWRKWHTVYVFDDNFVREEMKTKVLCVWRQKETQGHGMEPEILNTPSCISTSQPDPFGQQWSDHRIVTNLLIWDSVMVTCGLGDLKSQWIKVNREEKDCKERKYKESWYLSVCLCVFASESKFPKAFYVFIFLLSGWNSEINLFLYGKMYINCQLIYCTNINLYMHAAIRVTIQQAYKCHTAVNAYFNAVLLGV